MRVMPLVLLIAACGGGAPPPEEPIRYTDRNAESAAETARRAAEQAAAERAEREAAMASRDAARVAVKSVTLGPEDVGVDGELRAEAEIVRPAGAYVDVEYRWFVGGERVLGIDRDSATVGALGARRGQGVGVEVTTLDAKGGSSMARSNTVTVQNTAPRITTRLSWRGNLDGVRLDAEDLDDDPITWSVSAGPPGVSVARDGTLRVIVPDLQEAYDGELVLVASDGAGGRDELHIPVSVGAATAATVEERQVERKQVFEKMGQAEADEAAARETEKVSEMSPEEFEAYMKQRQQRR